MSLPQSPGFSVVSRLLLAYAAVPGLAELPLARNPRNPQHLAVGKRVVIVTELSDSPVGKAGHRETRRRVVKVGILSRVESADADADALYGLLSDTTQAALAQLRPTVITRMAEGEVQFYVDDIEVDGAVVVGSWEIDYTRERPATP